MFYKEPERNKKGQPICEICKVGYDRLLRHVGHRHGMNAAAYKKKFGHHPRKGIISEKLALKARKNALANYNTVILPNLIIGGQSTRFKDGNTSTDKALVSKIASARMTDYWESRKVTKQEIISRLIKAMSPPKKAKY